MRTKFIINHVCDLEQGTRRDGQAWFNREIVLTTADGSMYPDNIVASLWGDEAQNLKDRNGLSLTEGALVEAEISLRTYESNVRQGRWYQTASVFSIQCLS